MQKGAARSPGCDDARDTASKEDDGSAGLLPRTGHNGVPRVRQGSFLSVPGRLRTQSN